MRYNVPLQMAARAIVIPIGVSSLIELAMTSLRPVDGLLLAGKRDSNPDIPAVMFCAGSDKIHIAK